MWRNWGAGGRGNERVRIISNCLVHFPLPLPSPLALSPCPHFHSILPHILLGGNAETVLEKEYGSILETMEKEERGYLSWP